MCDLPGDLLIRTTHLSQHHIACKDKANEHTQWVVIGRCRDAGGTRVRSKIGRAVGPNNCLFTILIVDTCTGKPLNLSISNQRFIYKTLSYLAAATVCYYVGHGSKTIGQSARIVTWRVRVWVSALIICCINPSLAPSAPPIDAWSVRQWHQTNLNKDIMISNFT